jgi:PKHD-type hydroxylase
MLLDYHFYHFDSYFTKKFCNQVINFGKKINLQKGVVGNNDLNTSIRDSNVCFLNENWIKKEIYFLIKEANDATWNYNLSFPENIQFTEYALNQHYDWHVDTDVKKNSMDKIRKLSMIVALNSSEEYEGGDVLIKNMNIFSKEDIFKLDILKKTGSVVVFPSFLFHKVMPIVSGVRYSLVNWIRGDNFK